ncbi:MAG: thioredoxin family protein [Sphaerochaetaceae bacterium]
MKKVQLFYQPACPFCKMTLKWIEEVRKEQPQTASLPIDMIDELREPILADQYDYYFVPTFYVNGEKAHEGICTKKIVRTIMTDASAP